MTQQHSPVPWELHASADGRNSVRICRPDTTLERGCQVIAEAEILGMPRLEAEANARFIFEACNAHDDLLAACRFTLSVMRANHDDIELSERIAIEKLEAAIAKATSPSRSG